MAHPVERFNRSRYADDTSMDKTQSNHYLRYTMIQKTVQKIVHSHEKKMYKVLDVGCGPGHLAEYLQGIDKIEMYGCDISDEALKIAEKKGMKTTKVNLWEKFPFADKSFDIIIATEVIEHIYDTEYFIDEIKRILKDDGYLILTTPNVASLGRRFMLLLGKNPVLEYQLSGGAGHIRYFTFADMKTFLQNKGWTILSLQTDAINFSGSGKFYSRWLGKIFPSLGRCIFVVARKNPFQGNHC